MAQNIYWIDCKASKGQFSDELAISGVDYQGEEFSFFVNDKFVELDGDVALAEVDARLQVMVVKREDDLALIQLPGRTFGNGSTITVRAGDLMESGCRSPYKV